MGQQIRSMHVLLVEDNEGDILLTKQAFNRSKFDFQLYVARDGEEALDMVNRVGGFGDLPHFDLIMLDLNLPKRSGDKVIREIKGSPELVDIPVIMLSSSKAQIDIIKSYNLKANSYIVKANNTEQFDEIVRAIEICWFNALSRAV